jgi:hypothetical protein
MEQVEWDDVQGLLRDGLLTLPYAAYILWRCEPENVPAATGAKAWLKGLADRVIRAGDDDAAGLTNISLRRPRSLMALTRSLEEAGNSHRANRGPNGVGVVNLALTARGLGKFGVEDPERAQFDSEFREGMAPGRRRDRTLRVEAICSETSATTRQNTGMGRLELRNHRWGAVAFRGQHNVSPGIDR